MDVRKRRADIDSASDRGGFLSGTYTVAFSARIPAPAARVYSILADYRNGHPRILPRQFQNFVVEEGGQGAGTRTRFDMKAFGATRSFRHEVAEPEPGRVLVEFDRDIDAQTMFTVEPDGASACNVTIATSLPSRGGLFGAMERFMSRRYLLGVYKEELEKLEAVALDA